MTLRKLLRSSIKTTVIVVTITFLVFTITRAIQLTTTRIDVASCQDKTQCYPSRDLPSLITRQILSDFNLVSRLTLEASLILLLAQLVLRVSDKRTRLKA